ncbi:MAG: type II secretion system protein [Bacilli bacterium]
MKKLLNNKKGFTLIELLAVIVILAILVMVAIPAVTKYLTSARTSTFVDNAKSAINAVRNDVVINGKGSGVYTKTNINDLLEKDLIQSSFGADYIDSSCIKVVQTATDANGSTTQRDYSYTYSMCLIDKKGNGFELTDEDNINEKAIKVGTLVDKTCSCS